MDGPAGRVVIAIDLGGTKAAIATVRADGVVLGRTRSPSPRVAPDRAVAAWAARARTLPGAGEAVAVGMAMPAIVSAEGVVEWAAPSIPGWDAADVRALLEASFGLPAHVTFDGYAATAGEAVFGGGAGAHSVVAVIVGTGMGAGAWVDGRVLRGAAGVAGAVGHDRWPTGPGALSEPAESAASGPGILALARRLDPDAGFADTRAVFRAARAGHPAARRALDEATAIAGAVAGSVINVIAPEVVVWTGGVGARADFSGAASAVARACSQPFARGRTRFVRSRLGAESSLMGAAAGALAVADRRTRG
jgi:predicted NBD/HSP70 family sugar kinase